jgi:hypothetical protein
MSVIAVSSDFLSDLDKDSLLLPMAGFGHGHRRIAPPG